MSIPEIYEKDKLRNYILSIYEDESLDTYYTTWKELTYRCFTNDKYFDFLLEFKSAEQLLLDMLLISEHKYQMQVVFDKCTSLNININNLVSKIY